MNRKTIFAILILILVLNLTPASAQTTAFTHQGNLGFSASGNYDFEFKLFDTPTAGTGTQQGMTFSLANVQVTNGAFAAQIDFGSAVFTGSELFLETWWRVSGGGAYTVLSSREKVTAVYANRSLSSATADTATNASQLGGLPASGFIQNTTQQQAGSFNVAGDATAGGTLSGGVVNAATQFNIGDSRVLTVNGNQFSNTFLGMGAGASNTTGPGNSFFGKDAGLLNTTGAANSFFGTGTGAANTTAGQNAFFGFYAGNANTTGWANSFFGGYAGVSNTTGGGNSFFGRQAGYNNTTGHHNAFFGENAGVSNTTGSFNSFFGDSASASNISGGNNSSFGFNAGFSNSTGTDNVFFGVNAGDSNTTGSRNTMLGSRANLSASNFTNATAIGANAFVGQSDSLVLGSINGINGATADTFVGIGTPTPAAKLTVKAASTNSGDNTVHFEAPNIGPNASHVHWGTNGDWYIRSAAGSGRVILQDSGGNVGIGTNGPADRLHVNGIIRVDSLGFAGSTSLCRNASNQISGCSSSLRYKDQVLNYAAGLDTINRLRPVTFRWKDSGQPDIGLVAEEIEKIEPLLVT
jgi:hypothetical protein